MEHEEMQAEIWQNFQKLTRYAQLMQHIQKHAKENEQGLQRFGPIFRIIFWQSQFCMIMQIFRMTDPKKDNVLSIGNWLKIGFTIDKAKEMHEPINKELLQEAYDGYHKILDTELYKRCRLLRHKHYAHQDIDRWKLEDFESPTWTELYALITQLQGVYQQAGRANYCPGTSWEPIVTTPGYSGNFETLVRQFMESINKG